MTRRLMLLICAAAVAVSAQRPAPLDPAPLRAQLQTALDEWRATTGAPGATLGLVHRQLGVVEIASGLADRESKTPMRTTDLLLAGSVGKTFFAALALQLIDEGRLALDTPIATYLGNRPWLDRIAHGRVITVRHVMTHTSGLVRYEMNPQFTSALRAQPDKAWTPEERLAFLFDAVPPFAPGDGWQYSDTNYIVLGMVLEAVTRTPAYDEIARRFLTPLKLTRVTPVTSRVVPGLVPGYAGARDPLGLPDRVLQDGQFVVNPQFEWAGGGFATSAGDLAKWGHALYAGPAISSKARALMVDAAVPARLGPESRYALGVIIMPATPVGSTWGHSGFFPGYLTELVHAREDELTVAVQVNSSAPRPKGSLPPVRFAYDAIALARRTLRGGSRTSDVVHVSGPAADDAAPAADVETVATADTDRRRQDRTLVAVLAHPDDESAAGPVLARYAREGVSVHLITVTDGGMGFGGRDPGPDLAAASAALVKTRAEEAACSAAALGAAAPILLGFPDAKLGDYLSDRTRLPRLTERLAQEFERLRPGAIITWGPDGGSGHPDHRLVSSVVTQLIRAGAPGTTERLFYMYLPENAYRLLNPDRGVPPLLVPRPSHATTVVPFTPADLAAAQTAVQCHQSQWTPDVMKRMITATSVAWDGRVRLIPLTPGMTTVF